MSVPTTGTPLEIAKIEREKQTKELLGFGNSPISRADLAQMQEIQNLFNAHKQAGSQLLQAGRITTEEYYENTRQAGIKLGTSDVSSINPAHLFTPSFCPEMKSS